MKPILKEGYTVLKSLGQGGEGEAFLAHSQRARCNLVIKVRHRRGARNQISNEVNLSLGLMKRYPQSPNLCAVFDYDMSPTQTSIMIEYCDGGDLRHVLERMKGYQMDGFRNGSCPGSFVLHTMRHLGAGLLWLHCGLGCHLNSGKVDTLSQSWNPIFHRDIKPENILVRMTGKFDRGTRYPDIVLADFGLGATKSAYTSPWEGLESVEAQRFRHFTDRTYGPPEYVDNGFADPKHLSVKSSYDMWQLGAIVYELTTGRELRKTIDDKGSQRVCKYFIKHYGGINALIQEMVKTQPGERMTDRSLMASLNEWTRARDHEWRKEKGSDARIWFKKAFKELIESSGPPTELAQRTDGVRMVVPKESSSALGRAASKLWP
ncbi:hypothetical protein FKW77_010174 [Venturia effusa]|uniref:non-specific serine/threonine protein kinase n=1 Tax=Venturia effusa TaxID=50376 RepID=A0A517L4C9_9PEZI|nr:hypothetical protein FKW77_010174 [Venturia effusa]